MSELKPCPFCNGSASLVSTEKSPYKYWAVTCDKCGATGASAVEGKMKFEGDRLVSISEHESILSAWNRAIEAWNRRTKDD